MTNGRAKKLTAVYPGRTVLISHWSDENQCHELYKVNPDGTPTKIGEYDSMEQVIFTAQDKYGYGVVLVFDGI